MITPQGIVRVANSINSLNVGLVGGAAVAVSAMAGAATTEEVRYRILLYLAPVAKSRRRKRKEYDPIADHEILKTLSRRPGLEAHELRDLLPWEKPSMFRLALLERDGYVSSIRSGVRRRFYGSRNLLSPYTPAAMQVYDTIPSRILHTIESEPGIWEAKLAQNLGLSQQMRS